MRISAIIISFLVFWIVVGCKKPSLKVDGRTGLALHAALIDAGVVMANYGTNIHSIDELIDNLKGPRRTIDWDLYGNSDSYFNPDIDLWNKFSLSTNQPPQSPAVIIRSNEVQYFIIFFDGHFEATNQRPAEWCKKK